MGTFTIAKSLLAWLVLAASVQAGQFTFSSHVASGRGSANIFDGGPTVFGAGQTANTTDCCMSFRAGDDTGTGSLDALVRAFGESAVLPLGSEMRISVGFDVTYLPSLFPGGDRPGGTAEGQLSSVIEFPLPVDEIVWAYKLRIDDTIDFDGSSLVVVENVSESQTLLELDSTMPGFVNTTLAGQAGDIIRITSEMSGSGSAAPGVSTAREYRADLDMVFIIPEPTTFPLLALGAIVALRRRRR